MRRLPQKVRRGGNSVNVYLTCIYVLTDREGAFYLVLTDRDVSNAVNCAVNKSTQTDMTTNK